MISIEPQNLEFPFDTISKDIKSIVFTKTIKIRNTTTQKARFGIQFAQSDFEITHQRSGGVFPGEFETVTVCFEPTSWQLKQTVFYVKGSSSDTMIPVYITGIIL
jgi:hypothetical protein